jgi:hypothetical protein
MHRTPYPSNSLLKMKNLRVMTRPFDLVSLRGYSAGNIGVGAIVYIDELLEVSMQNN